jgi:hypothetical protein
VPEFSDSDKVTILLYLLEHQTDQIRRREQRVRQWFEWSTGLLLAAFGAVIALSGRSNPLPHPILIKLLATILITVPTILLTSRILRQSKASVGNAEAIERVQQLLHLFEDGYYGAHSPYPQTWEGTLAKGRLKRRSPYYYAFILVLMVACVVATIWLAL